MKPTNGNAIKLLQMLGMTAIVAIIGWNGATAWFNTQRLGDLDSEIRVLRVRTESNAELLTQVTATMVGKQLYARDIAEAAAGLKRVEEALLKLDEKLDKAKVMP